MQEGVWVVVFWRRQGDPDGDAHIDLTLVPGNWVLDGGDYMLRQHDERVLIPVIGHEHGEFIAAQAGHHASKRDDLAQSVRDDAEHSVASDMAMNVIDRLEPIEIDQHDRELIAGSARVQPLFEGF